MHKASPSDHYCEGREQDLRADASVSGHGIHHEHSREWRYGDGRDSDKYGRSRNGYGGGIAIRDYTQRGGWHRTWQLHDQLRQWDVDGDPGDADAEVNRIGRHLQCNALPCGLLISERVSEWRFGDAEHCLLVDCAAGERRHLHSD